MHGEICGRRRFDGFGTCCHGERCDLLYGGSKVRVVNCSERGVCLSARDVKHKKAAALAMRLNGIRIERGQRSIQKQFIITPLDWHRSLWKGRVPQDFVAWKCFKIDLDLSLALYLSSGFMKLRLLNQSFCLLNKFYTFNVALN